MASVRIQYPKPEQYSFYPHLSKAIQQPNPVIRRINRQRIAKMLGRLRGLNLDEINQLSSVEQTELASCVDDADGSIHLRQVWHAAPTVTRQWRQQFRRHNRYRRPLYRIGTQYLEQVVRKERGSVVPVPEYRSLLEFLKPFRVHSDEWVKKHRPKPRRTVARECRQSIARTLRATRRLRLQEVEFAANQIATKILHVQRPRKHPMRIRLS
jgi:hypothetical protein